MSNNKDGLIRKIDDFLLSFANNSLDGYSKPRIFRIRKVSSKSVQSYLRLTKTLDDNLFESLVFHRILDENKMFYKLEFKVSYFFETMTYGPFVKLIECAYILPEDKVAVLGGREGGWFLLGANYLECCERLKNVLLLYEPYFTPAIQKEAIELRMEPSLKRTLEIRRSLGDNATEANLVSMLKLERISHPRFSLECLAREAIKGDRQCFR
jgi:hypothetical protein